MDSPFLGMIQYYAFDWAPKYYALCNGALLSIAQNSALFSLLGTMYGGDGRVTFGLPDLRGRVANGMGNGYQQGQMSGTEGVTMNSLTMPSHTHATGTVQIKASSAGGDANSPNAAFPASPAASRGSMYANAAGTNMNLGAPAATVGVTGTGLPFTTLSPYLAVTAAIATAGIYPSRN